MLNVSYGLSWDVAICFYAVHVQARHAWCDLNSATVVTDA
jgi:hypothetical protein